MATRIYSRMAEIESEVRACENLMQAYDNPRIKERLSNHMDKLTTEYMNLATEVATMI